MARAPLRLLGPTGAALPPPYSSPAPDPEIFQPRANSTIAALKADYIKCLVNVSRGVEPLKQIIQRLLNAGARKNDLLKWAAQSGYSDTHIRNLINSLMRAAGVRSRKRGAGRKTPAKALEILSFAIRQCGRREAGRFLLAAHHAWKTSIAQVHTLSA